VVIGAIALLGFGVADVLIPARTDWFGTSRVVAPFVALLFLPLLVLAAVVRGRTGRWLAMIAVGGLVLGAARFLTGLPAGPVAPPPGTTAVDLGTWNVYLGTVPPDRVSEALLARAPAIIALEELTTAAAAALEADPAIRAAYPHRVLHPADDWSGMGLLSSWPLVGAADTDTQPPLIDAAIAVPGAARPLAVIAAHTPPPIWRPSLFGPAYDPGLRDATLGRVRARIDAHVAAGDPVVLLGDLNLTDRELAYDDLVRGLTDTYPAAGTGFGTTWRPGVADSPLLPFGLLRIDMAITGPGVTPLRSEPDCTPRVSDHCILDVTIALPAAAGD
jgi:endonuclease/exonuclease/phosphatase family metal-dependent hydrolase